jgi:thiol-disulfide isomerase/thioredoxin
MPRSLSSLIALFAVVYIAFQMLAIFSGHSPANSAAIPANSYVDANGRKVSLSDYFGKYLWVDYAAEWCSYCGPQARTLKGLEQRYRDQIMFLTVVTGTAKVMEPPSAKTAMQWARRFDLDPDRVLANFRTDTLPYHILYSPSGAILFQGSGLFDAGKITRVLSEKGVADK